ncbi:MAG: N-acetyltransferase family protein [Candidatus Limnocylindria bacterium]
MTPSPATLETVRLRDGSEILVRPMKSTDKGLLKAAFERLSPESRYRRFFSPVRHLTDAQLAYLTEVDHHDHEALVALSRGGDLVGVARFVRLADRPEAAEVAVTVADDWHGRGVATELLHRAVARARDLGVSRFTASCLADNSAVIEVLEQLRVTRFDHPEAGVIGLEIDLSEPAAPGGALRHALRGAATGELTMHRSGAASPERPGARRGGRPRRPARSP